MTIPQLYSSPWADPDRWMKSGRSWPPLWAGPHPQPVVQAVIERYKLIGGKSPLPELVKAQAEALARELGNGYRVYEGFRYSSPSVGVAFEKAVREGAGRVIGLSMSPFETIVTTGAYRKAFESAG